MAEHHSTEKDAQKTTENMTTEFAGAIEIEPPLSAAEVGYVRRLADGGPESMAWVATRDGTRLRPKGRGDIAAALTSLRLLVGTMEQPRRFRGTVAAYDVRTRDLVAITSPTAGSPCAPCAGRVPPPSTRT